MGVIIIVLIIVIIIIVIVRCIKISKLVIDIRFIVIRNFVIIVIKISGIIVSIIIFAWKTQREISMGEVGSVYVGAT